MADICDCGRTIEQPATGRPRRKCKVCSPPRSRRPTAPVLPMRASSQPGPAAKPRPTLEERTRAELQEVGRDETSAGVAALALAELFDAGGYNAQGAAALVKAHREALELALAGAHSEADVIELIFGAEA